MKSDSSRFDLRRFGGPWEVDRAIFFSEEKQEEGKGERGREKGRERREIEYKKNREREGRDEGRWGKKRRKQKVGIESKNGEMDS